MKEFTATAHTKNDFFPIRRLSDIPENFFDIKKSMFIDLHIDIDNPLYSPRFLTIIINDTKPFIIELRDWLLSVECIDEIYSETKKKRIINKYNKLFKDIRYTFLEQFYYSL